MIEFSRQQRKKQGGYFYWIHPYSTQYGCPYMVGINPYIIDEIIEIVWRAQYDRF